MKYQEIPDFDQLQLELLESDQPGPLILALLSVVLNSDRYELAVEVTEKFIFHPNPYVRGAAMESIGHIARLWKKIPDDLIEGLHRALKDEGDWVRGKAEIAIEDVEHFIE